MSDIFALDLDGQNALKEEARLNPLELAEAKPGFFAGAAQGIGSGILRGGARAGQFIAMADAAPGVLYERATGQEGRFTDPYFKVVDEYVNRAVDSWTPDAAEVGKAGQVLGGLAEIALPLMATGGNPALLIGSQEMGVATDLVRQGVDSTAAVGAGVVQGAATAVGFKIPFLGKTLASRVASGALGNLAVNAPAAALQQQILQSYGADEAAAQFDPFNLEARMVDVLAGAAFGGLAHVQLRASDREAALAANNAKHFQHDTAPGAPLDVPSAIAHQKAMELATEQLIRGEPVTTPRELADAQFAARVPQTDGALDETIAKEVGVPLDPPPEPKPAKIPDELAPVGNKAAPGAAGEAPAAAPVAATAGEPLTPHEAASEAPLLDVNAARQALGARDVMLPTGEIDANGGAVTRSAREVMTQLDEEMKQVKSDAKGFDAAVSCFLQGGP